MLWEVAARAYAHVVWFMAKKLGVWLPGLGWVCRHIRRERLLRFQDRTYVFHPGAASMYGALLIGKSMEPETHAFFRKIIPHLPQRLGFVDVGAAIGEMVIQVAGYPNVERVIAFDPDPDNVEACRRSAAVNRYGHVQMLEKVVADDVRELDFELNLKRGTSGRIVDATTHGSAKLVSTTLDRELSEDDLDYLMLIDVEGAELLVLQGGAQFIQRKRPLIIFEYITGRDHHLPEVRTFLGDAYELYRLREDGTLDTDMRRTWNLVAVHRNSVFYPVCLSARRGNLQQANA